MAPTIDRLIDRCGHLSPRDIAQTAPIIDICQTTHDRLYSRLFQS
jgi:urease accessory protein UreF